MSDTVTVPYRMNSDARVKKVLKDLGRILKEMGVETKLPRLKTAVAGIFGYAGWDTLEASIGGNAAVGPEDHDLEAAALSIRRSVQVAALARLVATDERAEEVLARLRPTGRAAGAVAEMPRVSVVSTGLDYHPCRVSRVWDDLYELVDDFDGSSSGAEDLVAAWSDSHSMHPLDLAVCRRASSENEMNLDTVFGVTDGSHVIVDASALAGDLAAREVDKDTFKGIGPAYGKDVYVHFGANAFPSPYMHAGVEGAYVSGLDGSTDGSEDGLPDSVVVKLVCSMPFQDTVSFDDVSLLDPVQNLRDHLRGPYLEVFPSDGVDYKKAVRRFRGRKNDVEAAAWADYVAAPAAAALNAVKMIASRECAVADAVLGALKPEVSARLERSTTEKRLLSTVSKFDEGEMLVRYLGRQAPAPDVATERAEALKQGRFEDDGYVLQYFNDIHGYQGDDRMEIARRMTALVLANVVGGPDFVDGPDAAFVRSECRAFLINTGFKSITYDVGADTYKEPEILAIREDMLATIREAVDDGSNHAKMTMPMVWLAAYALGFDEEAAAAWERAHEIAAFKRNGVLSSMKEVVDEERDANGEDFVAVVEWFTRRTYAQTKSAHLKPWWDKWPSAADVLPRTPELEAFLAEAGREA
jgi:hypothetical protein